MVGHILKAEILRAPKLGVINKHAGLLPANRGLLPYFWARLKGERQGVSCYKLGKGIDEGSLYYQEVVDVLETKSMVQFYSYVFRGYPAIILEALRNMTTKRELTSAVRVTPSYQSLPSQSEYREFRKKGGKVIRLQDLLAAFSL